MLHPSFVGCASPILFPCPGNGRGGPPGEGSCELPHPALGVCGNVPLSQVVIFRDVIVYEKFFLLLLFISEVLEIVPFSLLFS